MEDKKKSGIWNFVGSVLFLVVIALMVAGIALTLLPLLKEVAAHANDEQMLVDTLREYGTYKMPITLILLQALQIITIVFPCAAVQVLAGLCSGIVLGTAYCVLGYIVGNWVVFLMVRRFSGLFSKTGEKQGGTFGFLKDSKNPEMIAFWLFLIPGIPNGILPYIFAKTKVDMKRYLIAITCASIPSIAMCSITGGLVAQGNFVAAILVAAVVFVVFVLVVLFRKKILEKIKNMAK